MSLPWRVVEQQIQQRIVELQDKLEKVEPENLRHTQGTLAGLRWVLDLPRSLADVNDETRRISD